LSKLHTIPDAVRLFRAAVADKVVDRQIILQAQGLTAHMREATHVIWTTGGRFFPDDEFERYLRRGAKARDVSDHEKTFIT